MSRPTLSCIGGPSSPSPTIPSTLSLAATENLTMTSGGGGGGGGVCTKRVPEVAAEAGAELACTGTIIGLRGSAAGDVTPHATEMDVTVQYIDGGTVRVGGVVSRTVTGKLPLTPLPELSSA